jgi:hypothetical protein
MSEQSGSPEVPHHDQKPKGGTEDSASSVSNHGYSGPATDESKLETFLLSM